MREKMKRKDNRRNKRKQKRRGREWKTTGEKIKIKENRVTVSHVISI
jgi:hypothetical protein